MRLERAFTSARWLTSNRTISGWDWAAARISAVCPRHVSRAFTFAPAFRSSFAASTLLERRNHHQRRQAIGIAASTVRASLQQLPDDGRVADDRRFGERRRVVVIAYIGIRAGSADSRSSERGVAGIDAPSEERSCRPPNARCIHARLRGEQLKRLWRKSRSRTALLIECGQAGCRSRRRADSAPNATDQHNNKGEPNYRPTHPTYPLRLSIGRRRKDKPALDCRNRDSPPKSQRHSPITGTKPQR